MSAPFFKFPFFLITTVQPLQPGYALFSQEVASRAMTDFRKMGLFPKDPSF